MTTPFKYNPQAFGGTEYMGRGFEKNIAPHMPKLKNYFCAIAPGVENSFNQLLNAFKPIIFWMHNTPIQFGPEGKDFLSTPEFLAKLAYIVVVSESAKKEVLEQTKVPAEKIYVIPNAIDPLVYDSSKFDNLKQIRLIHTSSMDRGFDILMNGLTKIDEDFRLDVFNKFNPDEFPNQKFDDRFRFHGFTPKRVVLDYYEQAHIHAYPSTYPETFCISQVEAMSAGLLCVTSDLGAIPEVSGGHTTIYPYAANAEEHQQRFTARIENAIKLVKSGSWNPTAQIEYANKTYSWDAAKENWLRFHELI